MDVQKNNTTINFGLTSRYSKAAELARQNLNCHKIYKSVDGAKDAFAQATENQGIKGDFCITDIIRKTTDDFVVRFFIKEDNKTTFNDQFTVNMNRDIIKMLTEKEMAQGKGKNKKNKSTYNMQEKIVEYFQQSYNKHQTAK